MANVGKLAVVLSADGTQLRSGFDRAMRDVDQFKSKINKALNFATSIPGIGAIGGTVLGALSVDSFKESIDGIVEMGKSAQKLGFTIRDLSALMTLEGPDFSTEAMLTGVRKLQVAMQDALDPKSSEAKLFGKHGLDPVKMIGAGTLGSLKMFADTMERATNASERLKLAMAMGKTGHELIPFLLGGSNAITGAMEEAKNKHQEVSYEMARAAKEVALAIDAIDDAWKKVKNTLASGVAPKVSGALKGVERIMSGDVSAKEGAMAVVDRVGPLTLLDALQKEAKHAPKMKLFDDAFLRAKMQPIEISAVEKEAAKAAEQARAAAKHEQRWEEMRPQREAGEAENKAKLDRAAHIQKQIEAGVNWVHSAMDATGAFFRAGEGKLMQRQGDRVSKIADVAQGMLGKATELPHFAEFGSQESIDAMARSISWGGDGQKGDMKRIAEAAEKQVAEDERRHKELLEAIAELGVIQGKF